MIFQFIGLSKESPDIISSANELQYDTVANCASRILTPFSTSVDLVIYRMLKL